MQRPFRYYGGRDLEQTHGGPYAPLKKSLCRARDQAWAGGGRRTQRLRDSLQELEELLAARTPVLTSWTSADRLLLVFADGAVARLSVEAATGDLCDVFIDRSLEGGPPADITDATLAPALLLLAHGTPQLTLVHLAVEGGRDHEVSHGSITKKNRRRRSISLRHRRWVGGPCRRKRCGCRGRARVARSGAASCRRRRGAPASGGSARPAASCSPGRRWCAARTAPTSSSTTRADPAPAPASRRPSASWPATTPSTTPSWPSTLASASRICCASSNSPPPPSRSASKKINDSSRLSVR